MRNANERLVDSGIYARIQELRMSGADRQNAIAALERAEQLSNAILWLREKVADIGHLFLKPDLKH